MAKDTKTTKYFDSRAKVPQDAQWALNTLYKDEKEWQKHYKLTTSRLAKISAFQGKLKKTKTILQFFNLASEIMRELEKLYVFAGHQLSVDLANSKSQAMEQQASELYTKFKQAVSFQAPEMLKLPVADLKKMYKDAKFHLYHREMRSLIEQKQHILTTEGEELLSLFSKANDGPEAIFSALDNVDIKFEDIELSSGKKLRLTSANYSNYLENQDQEIRKKAFENLYKAFKEHNNTLAQILILQVKQHNIYRLARKYKSSVEASLSPNFIDVKVFENLIKSCSKILPIQHEYLAYRAKRMKMKKLNMWDLRVPFTTSKPFKFTYEEAVDICTEAVKPLGEEYVRIMRAGLLNGWVDKYENKGKRGGAFSGGCYDSLPFILMNFTGSINDVYTLIHEAGHSMHSYLARSSQPYQLSDYSLFAAEIASTVNERLLTDYFLKKYSGDKRKIILIYELDAIKATFYRQTMFAEFELSIHDKIEKGEPMTVDSLNSIYKSLNKKYHGAIITDDSYIQYEWSRIPHFYYNFYTFQYATGIAAAIYFTDKILSRDGVKWTAKYLEFLNSGGNDFPLENLKKAGLDFTKGGLYTAIAKRMEKCLNLLKEN